MSSTTRFGLSLFLLIATIGCGKIVVSPVRDTDTFESFGGGVFYALPMTMITLEIPVTKIERKVVHFPDSTLLASSPLGHNNPDALITTYDLGDIAISSRPVPDAEKIFNVAIKGNWKKTQALQLSMNDLGILSKAEAEVEDHTFDIVIQAAQSIAGITQALVSFKGSDPAKMTKDSCQISKYKAELRQIREARFSLLKSDGNLGYGHMPEGALRLRLDELKRQEENLISLMTYAETKTKLLIRKDILIRNPEDIANLSENPVFWFDKSSGLMLPEDEKPPVGSNLRIYKSFRKKMGDTRSGNGYYLHVLASPRNSIESAFSHFTMADLRNRKTRTGLVYNLPSWFAIKLTEGKATDSAAVAGANLPMPQLGKIAFLSPKVSTNSIELDPATGALRSVSMKTSGITGDQVKNAGAALSSGAALLKPQTPLEKLQNSRALLEEQEKILKLRLSLDSLDRQR